MMKIDVGKEFELVDKSHFFKPPDYTDYPSGKECTISKVQGFISLTGEHKRDGDKLVHAVAAKNNQVPIGKDKPVQNVGILSMVDRFFDWINKALGS